MGGGGTTAFSVQSPFQTTGRWEVQAGPHGFAMAWLIVTEHHSCSFAQQFLNLQAKFSLFIVKKLLSSSFYLLSAI